jgi:hypothetical protein
LPKDGRATATSVTEATTAYEPPTFEKLFSKGNSSIIMLNRRATRTAADPTKIAHGSLVWMDENNATSLRTVRDMIIMRTGKNNLGPILICPSMRVPYRRTFLSSSQHNIRDSILRVSSMNVVRPRQKRKGI